MKKLMYFDGAMGTELQARGLEIGHVPTVTYNFTHPEVIKEIHRGYLEVGSNFITTNTFSCNPYFLTEAGYTVKEVITQAVKLAKEVRDEFSNRFIALDIGSTGRKIDDKDDVGFEELYNIFKEQVVEGGRENVDAIILETFMDINELRAAILAAKENANLPIFATMSFEPNGYTFYGASIEEMVHLAKELNIDAVGINCSAGPSELVPLVQRLVEITDKKIIIQPNAGIPSLQDDKTKYPISLETFSQYMKQFADMGVQILGGCCGTNKEYIKRIVGITENKK